MMKIENAYYMKQMPTRIAIKLKDGTLKHASLIPFRQITENDLKPLIGYYNIDNADSIPDYTLKFYGLDKE